MTTWTTTTKPTEKRRYRVECYLIGNHGGHIGKRIVEVEAFNKDDAMNAARRLNYTPVRIV